MKYKKILFLNVLLLNLNLIMCMEKDEKKVQEFAYFNQLPEDIQKEILKFATGVNPEDLKVENLKSQIPKEILNNFNNISKLRCINKKFKTLIDILYFNNFNKNKIEEIIIDNLKKREYHGKLLLDAITNKNLDATKKIIMDESPIDSSQYRLRNMNALMYASLFGFKEIVELLINNARKVLTKNEFKEYIDRQDKTGRSAIMLTCLNNKHKVANLLINANANLDLIEKDGNSVLMYAAIFGSKETIKILIENGAKTDIKDKAGKDALDLAKDQGTSDFIKKLLSDKENKKQKIN